MRKNLDDVTLCQDCHQYLQTGDPTFLDYHYSQEEAASKLEDMEAGLREFQCDYGNLHTLGVELEFSNLRCDICETTLAGKRYRYATFVR